MVASYASRAHRVYEAVKGFDKGLSVPVGYCIRLKKIAFYGLPDGRVRIRRAAGLHSDDMRVMGIDCGTELTGYGVVETDSTARTPMLVCRGYGAVRLSKQKTMAERLLQVFEELTGQMRHHQPDVVAIEEVFYSVNAKSALKLGQVRGVALLAAATVGLPLAEYAPLTIKSSVVGYGLASKEQVQFMVARLLELDKPPEPADAADALAVAICHLHTAQTLAMQARLS